MPANLIGGSIGYLIFLAAGTSGLRTICTCRPTSRTCRSTLSWSSSAGCSGWSLATISGALFRVVERGIRALRGREVERALAAGLVFSIVGMIAPNLLFSGETQIQTVVANPAATARVSSSRWRS